jgi:hypothetical protein
VKKVRLDDIAMAIGSDSSEGLWYLDTEFGITEFLQLSVMDAVLRRIELPIDIPADIGLMYKLAQAVISDNEERFIKLPGEMDILEWDFMRRFAVSRMDPVIANDLSVAIQGANAFQAFNARLRKHKLQDEWERHREESLRDTAAEWCVQHGVPFE